MEALGSFLRVLNVLPREKIEGPPRDFLKANLRPHPRPDQRPKTRGARGLDGTPIIHLLYKREKLKYTFLVGSSPGHEEGL